MNARLLPSVVCATLLLASPAFAAVHSDHPTPSITVAGDAEVRVVPDEVFFTIAVSTLDKDVLAATKENEAKLKKLLDTAKAFGIPANQIQTGQVSIDRREHSNAVLIGFQVSRSVTLCLKDLSRFEALFMSMVKNGANDLPGIEFRSTKMEEARSTARLQAVKAAKAKAAAMAGELGEKIGRPLAVTEDRPTFSQFAYTDASNGGGVHGGFAPGELAVKVTVNVQFAFAG